MNILTKTLIKGEVFLEYAFFSFEFLFENETDTPALAEYRFPLPEGSVISSLKIVTKDRGVVRASVISRSHAENLYEAGGIAVLRRLDNEIYSLGVDVEAKENIKVIVGVYSPLAVCGEEVSLVIPLAIALGRGKSKNCAEIELDIHDAEAATCPSHPARINQNKSGFYVETGEILADRDFCLNIRGRRKNTAIVTRDGVKYQMLCKVYPEKQLDTPKERKYKKLMLVYDSKTLTAGAAAAAKELVCTLCDQFDGEYAVIMADGEFCSITDGFCRFEENELIARISGFGYRGEMFLNEQLRKKIDEETLPIFICGGELSQDPFGSEFEKSGICTVTLGGTSFCKKAKEISALCGGRHRHIFGGDNIKECAQRIMSDFCREADDEIKAVIKGGDAFVAGGDANSGILIYAEGVGEPQINDIQVICGEKRQRVLLNKVEVYRSFAPIGLVCADYVYKELNKRLSVCLPEEIYEIRRQMEEVGVRFSALNCETAMAAEYSNALPGAMRVILDDGACRSFEAFGGRNSAFKEKDIAASQIEENKKMKLYAELIARNLRANGAICASGEINKEAVRYQTLICCLALVSAGFAEEYKEIVIRAERYLAQFGKEFKITYDMAKAREKLGAIIAPRDTDLDGIPDILTAAQLLWQNTREKEAYFC